jgi:hypothetical protein
MECIVAGLKAGWITSAEFRADRTTRTRDFLASHRAGVAKIERRQAVEHLDAISPGRQGDGGAGTWAWSCLPDMPSSSGTSSPPQKPYKIR